MELPITRELYLTFNRMENDRILRNVYTFCEKTKKDNYNQLLSYHLHKVPRKFIFETGKTFSNLHSCGLFSYCALLTNSCSHFRKTEKTVFAWLKGPLKYYGKIMGLKTEKQILQQFEILKAAKLINYRVKEGEYIVFLLEGTVDTFKTYTRKEVIAQYAAIKTHSGYVFVNETNIKELLNNASFYSEADAMVDLWLNTIYNDLNLPISENPIVYLDEDREKEWENVNVTTKELSKRWGCSFGRVNKLLKKMVEADFIDVFILPNIGSVIFNKAYFTYFKKDKTYKRNALAIYKKFQIKTCIIRYVIYLYKNRLNISRKEYLLEFIRFIKLLGFSPYKNKCHNKSAKTLNKRIEYLLSLFDFSCNVRNTLFKRVLGLFFEKA